MSKQSGNARRALVEKALRELRELKAKVKQLEYAKSEPIAIIGMGCRFPGGNSPQEWWPVLRDGLDTTREVPKERWDIDAFYDPDPDAPNKMYVRQAAFLHEFNTFDAPFFGISPREAANIDPQQRLLLEVSWEALEHAGVAPDQLLDSKTGVYIGLMTTDYAGMLTDINDPYVGLGTGLSYPAGRISYMLGLQGPSMVIATECSSSLVTTHLACQALRAGECDLALSGGVNLILSPYTLVLLSKMRAMAKDGRCKTFDAAADGYGRGEGCGVLVLKRLSDALRDDDTIWAVIRGSAVNHDGPSGGLTVPNGPAQEKVLREAMAAAGVTPDKVAYVEAHGTGTSLGDPIELFALGATMAKGRSKDNPLLVGSVKTNVGHLEAAAGVAGLIKVTLALHHQKLPPHLHLNTPNPNFLWDQIPIKVVTELTEWPNTHAKRVAGVSSFGMSGINAHVILEEAPQRDAPAASGRAGERASGQGGEREMLWERSHHMLCLSAKTEEALNKMVGRYVEQLTRQPELELANLCFTANTGRTHFEHRLAVVAESNEQLRQKLISYEAGSTSPGMISGEVPGMPDSAGAKIAFLFTGQGSQYVEMGRQLYETHPIFRQTLIRCDEILRDYLERPLLSVLYPPVSPRRTAAGASPNPLGGPSQRSGGQALGRGGAYGEEDRKGLINQTAYTQPALFALEYALAELWQSWGINPSVVMGHSVGEYVAACVAGVFSLEDGLKLIAERARLMNRLPAGGEMVALLASEAKVAQVIRPYAKQVSIAAINGPKSVVISGSRQAIERVVSRLTREGIKSQKLTVSHAFHSPLMEPIWRNFERVARAITFREPRIKLVSNLSGKLVKPGEVTSARYWCRHIREAVRFADGMQTLAEMGVDTFIEIGPKPILLGMGRQSLSATTDSNSYYNEGEGRHARGARRWLPTQRPNVPDWQQLLSSLGELYVQGLKVDWSGFEKPYADHRRRVVLPTYPWQHTRYWVEPPEHPLVPISSPVVSSHVMNLLHQGETEQLAEQLAQKALASGALSATELDLLPKLLDLLAKQHQQDIALGSLKEWLYEIEWQPALTRSNDFSRSGPETMIKCVTTRWLILAERPAVHDGTGVGEALAKLLRERGQDVTLVYAHDIRTNNGQWDLDALLEGSFKGVIHLWGLELPANLLTEAKETDKALDETQRLTYGSVLTVVQTLAKKNSEYNNNGQTRLWVVTRGAVPVREVTNVAQAPLWGIGKVVALEQPNLWGGLLDLAPASSQPKLGASEAEAAQVLAEIMDSDALAEDQVAFRDGVRFVPRLAQKSPLSPSPLSLRPDASYLITGGLGHLGVNIARWMVEQGTRHLILTSRRGISNQTAQETVDQLRAAGCELQVVKADVSKPQDVTRLLAQISETPLRGIIHAAGVSGTEVITEMTFDTFASILRPKVIGSWLLHQESIAQKIELDFFVMCSSIASVWGSAGQAHYAAANQFLDALAHYRREQDLPALSINWGPWAGGGIASAEAREWLKRRGLTALEPEAAVEALAYLMGSDSVQTTVAQVDWTLFKKIYEARGPRAFLSALDLSSEGESDVEDVSATSDLLQQLLEAPPNMRLDLLTAHLSEQLSAIMGLSADGSAIEPQQGFFTIGMDSLMAVELRTRLEKQFGSSLSPTLAFDYPNLEQLANHLAKEVLGWELEEASATEAASPEDSAIFNTTINEAVSGVEELSEDELAALIDDELAFLTGDL